MTAALVLIGAVSAQAWVWASLSSTAAPPISMNGGGGYGNLVFGAADVTLQSWLRDTKVGDGRVYAHVRVDRRNGTGTFVYISSGKRSEGEASFARMADQKRFLDNGSGTFKYMVDICRSTDWNDPCSEDKRRLNW